MNRLDGSSMRKSAKAACAVLAATLLTGCALITVPVEFVGDVASTTVKTAGTIVSAPFKLLGAGDAEPKPAEAPAPAPERK